MNVDYHNSSGIENIKVLGQDEMLEFGLATQRAQTDVRRRFSFCAVNEPLRLEKQGPNLQNVIRQSYDYLTMNLRRTANL